MTGADSLQPDATAKQGSIRTRWWFASFAAWVVILMSTSLIIVLNRPPVLDFSGWAAFKDSVAGADTGLMLMIIAIYMSFACTFTMLNTGWLVSAAAIAPGVTGEFYSTVFLVATAGAAGSTMANLNDYHIFTPMLRSKKIASVKNTRIYAVAEKWFSGHPFGILVFFNIAPIPVDVSRPLAASYGYSRIKFATANLLGRFARYGIIAAITYRLGKHGWVATLSLLAVAVVMLLARVLVKLAGSGDGNEKTTT